MAGSALNPGKIGLRTCGMIKKKDSNSLLKMKAKGHEGKTL